MKTGKTCKQEIMKTGKTCKQEIMKTGKTCKQCKQENSGIMETYFHKVYKFVIWVKHCMSKSSIVNSINKDVKLLAGNQYLYDHSQEHCIIVWIHLVNKGS